ncbi:hypothetical protein EV363DRAFT_1540658, partial [Boletus edulis]
VSCPLLSLRLFIGEDGEVPAGDESKDPQNRQHIILNYTMFFHASPRAPPRPLSLVALSPSPLHAVTFASRTTVSCLPSPARPHPHPRRPMPSPSHSPSPLALAHRHLHLADDGEPRRSPSSSRLPSPSPLPLYALSTSKLVLQRHDENARPPHSSSPSLALPTPLLSHLLSPSPLHALACRPRDDGDPHPLAHARP